VNRRRLQLVLAVGLLSLFAAVGVAAAGGWGGDKFRERLTSYEEVPAVSSDASGEFEARISRFSDEIEYELSYEDLEGNVTQAHIHFGQRDVNGGISLWLCANNPPIMNAPPGTQPCPPAPATISGTLDAGDLTPVPAQGLDAGDFDEIVDAIRSGVTYANVHSSRFGGGEIRAQIEGRDRD
jgi:hypothetical protein